MFLLYTVVLLIFTESKGAFVTMSEKLDRKEFLTLTKFLVMAGLILPIVPDTPFVSFLAITPYKIWLAVVVISSISYISYLLRKFVFKDSGLILSGILGGLYSSTATTVVLARKLKLAHSGHMQYAATIIMATGMMYLRVGILMLIFNKALFLFLALAMGCMVVLSFATGGVMLYLSRKHTVKEESTEESDKNPLEFKVAVIFTLIYVIFTFLTFYTIQEYGIRGLNILSVFVGVADIDPFLLNLFQGKYQVTMAIIGSATFTAIISNNVAKMLYASFLAGHKKSKYIYIAFGIIIIMNLLFLLLL
jgi:uncharacterized membrane protein (DUF4010 family)